MRKLYLGIAAVAAVAIGVGIAEMQHRITAGREAEKAAAAQVKLDAEAAKDQQAFLAMLETQYAVLRRDRGDLIGDIRKDCTFRFPGKFRLIESCTEDGAAALDQMKELFVSDETTPRQQAAIAYCMDQRASLNGVEWTSVPYCYQQAVVQIRKLENSK